VANPNDSLKAQAYDEQVNLDSYHLEPGVCILPLCEDPPTDPDELATYSPVVRLRLHAPFRVRTSTVRSDKRGSPPVIPTPQDTGKFQFMGADINFLTNLNVSFDTFDWKVMGVYQYVEACASRPEDGFVLCSAPVTYTQETRNARRFAGYPAPLVGAVASGGANARVGYTMGQMLASPDTPTGLPIIWTYNMSEFYPGTLFNDGLMNGGGVNAPGVSDSIGNTFNNG
jgi:hypothetical protein